MQRSTAMNRSSNENNAEDGGERESSSFDDQPLNNRRTVPLILESIKGTDQIDLRDLFFNSNWSAGRRIMCSVFLGVGCLVFLLTIIALISGMIKSLNYIANRDKLLLTGLFMVPNVIDNRDSVLAFDVKGYDADEDRNPEVEQFVAEIDEFLSIFKKECEDSRGTGNDQCNLNRFVQNTDCTKQSSYGFFKGEPCIILGLRQIGHYYPKKPLYNTYYSPWSDENRFDADHIPVSCQESNFMRYSFGDDQGKFSYFPNAGMERKYLDSVRGQSVDLGPIMFVQLKNLTQVKWRRIECKFLADNIDDFNGVKQIKFEYRFSEDYDPLEKEEFF